ncbi:MAG: PD-(D/E)XK nuclease family protein [Corallococcus sp.]|nr:PD-(D/E)XK nuclease family protein [Corallococcus sp.]
MITIYKTNTMKCAEMCIMDCLKNVDARNLEIRNIVVVPDRASHEAEKSLLGALNGSFNSEVLTFRRLAGRLLPDKFEYLPKQAGIIVMTRIIAQVKSQFVCYKKGVDSKGFVENMYDTISCLKYCRIPPEKLFDEQLPQSVKGKLHDIGIIYQSYRQFTEMGRADSSDKLDMLCEYLDLSDKTTEGNSVKNTRFYFYDFDNFSAQEFAVIEKLIVYSKGVTVACCVSHNKQERHLYLNDIYDGIISVCKRLGEKPTEIVKTYHRNAVTEQIGNNLYSYAQSGKPLECGDFVELYKGNTRSDEVYALACKIQKFVRSGGRYSDIYVVTSDVTAYANAVKLIFDEFEIPFFVDLQTKLSDHAYCRFIIDYLTVIQSGMRLNSVLSFVKNHMFEGGEGVYKFENFCLKYNVNYNFDQFRLGHNDEYYSVADAVREKFKQITDANRIKPKDTATEYVAAIRKLKEFCDLDQKAQRFADAQFESKLYDGVNFTNQVADKTENVLVQMEKLLGNAELTLEEFIAVFTAAAESVNLSVLPALRDSVVFANMAKARRHDIGFLALLGANHGYMPIIKGDCKLLSDDNISSMNNSGIAIEPKVFVENKRERFSLYQLLQEPVQKLFVSCTLSDGKNSLLPSSFVTQLAEMFTKDGVPLSEEGTADREVYTVKQGLYKTVEAHRKIADKQPVNMPSYEILYGYFKEQVDRYCQVTDKTQLRINGGDKLFLWDMQTTVSRITDFFKCPYKFYLHYGLSVKPREVSDLKSSNLGDILHAVLENYVRKVDLSESDAQTKTIAEKCFDDVMQDDFYKGILSDASMRNTLKQLKREAVKMCKVVKKQFCSSDFVNYATELSFGTKYDLEPVEVDFGGGKFLLLGKIDRVDVCGDKFIVIDYKSGSAASEYSEKSLYLGHKLQLLVYLKAVIDNLHLTPVGFYYFNLHNNFTDANTVKVYSYNGRTLDDVSVAQSLDNNLKNGFSEKLGLKLAKNGEINKTGAKVITASQLDAQIDYSLRLIADAGRHMRDGYIAVSPYEGVCSYCEYASACDFGDLYTNEPRSAEVKVNAETIEEIVNG